jgi:large subunit ribosomal protein L18
VRHERQIGHQRSRRRLRVRNRIKRDSTRPRLSVFRSHKHMYAQIIDDGNGRTLVAASTLDKPLRTQLNYGGNCQAATILGQTIAQRALEAGIRQVAFDRREYKYHGRVAALADAARDAGLDLGAKKVAPEPAAEPEPKAKKKGEKGAKGEKGEKKPKEKKAPKES